MKFPETLERFIRLASKLPGIGYKTGERLGFFILSETGEYARDLGKAVADLKANIAACPVCGAISEGDACPVCSDAGRDSHTLCVVEQALDIYYIENAAGYHGLYHVLGGVISPLNGVTPQDLHIAGLLTRLAGGGFQEIIFALSPTTEGDTTALYIRELLKESGLKMTHLARGIPVGTDLQYAGSGSVAQAFKHREEIK